MSKSSPHAGSLRAAVRRARWVGCLAATVAVWLAGSSGALAADADGKFAVKGAARTLCERFVRARDDRGDNPRPYVIYESWLEGYLTALNERSPGTYDLTSFESTELLAALVYANCKRNPKEPYFNVVRRLVVALNSSRITTHSELVEVKGELPAEGGGKPRKIDLHLYEETVRRMQNSLASAGFYKGEVDGKYGPGTRKAMHDYQAANGLEASGLPDQFSLLKLFRPPAPSKEGGG